MDTHPRNKRSNMRDVAHRAGVSVATVSRVLSGTHKVAQTTRERVESAIEALNFVPSPAARAINSGRTHLIGALVPTLDHAIFSRFLYAIELQLAKSGLSLLVATTDSSLEREAERAGDLLNLGVEGLIVSGITRSPDFSRLTARHEVPVVATSYFAPHNDLPTIGYDNEEVSQIALSHLLELGHTEVAILSGPPEDSDRTRARLDGLHACDGCTLRVQHIALDFAAAGDATERCLDTYPGVTAILGLSDVLAQGALFRLQNLGVPVPDAMSVMGMDDLPGSAYTWPALTSVQLPVDEMGRRAADALATWVEYGTRPEPRKLPSSVARRASTSRPGPQRRKG